jgi:hypothetical protein
MFRQEQASEKRFNLPVQWRLLLGRLHTGGNEMPPGCAHADC